MGAIVAIFAPLLISIFEKIFDLIEGSSNEHMKKEARARLNKFKHKHQRKDIEEQREVSEIDLLEARIKLEQDPDIKKQLIAEYRKRSDELFEKPKKA